jgi:septal ring factor EnvC (AmiA/AmiB activator)
LAHLKGKLPLPIDGAKVVKRFGKQKVEGFKDYVLSKGLTFEVEEPGSFAAIAAGRVLYSGRMPGYGTILILDHGSRMYSLYGQLREVSVRKGDDVAAGQELGHCSEIGDGKGQFYFEIRKNGKPIDPAPYLRK